MQSAASPESVSACVWIPVLLFWAAANDSSGNGKGPNVVLVLLTSQSTLDYRSHLTTVHRVPCPVHCKHFTFCRPADLILAAPIAFLGDTEVLETVLL